MTEFFERGVPDALTEESSAGSGFLADVAQEWEAATQLARDAGTDAILSPIRFISAHMEVLFDLDTDVRTVCAELGLNMIRAAMDSC